jgi:hypothetical protein
MVLRGIKEINMVYRLKGIQAKFTAGLIWMVMAIVILGSKQVPTLGQSAGYALRFYGNGYGDIDRVKIKINNPEVPADIGTTHITVEFWMKAAPGANTATAGCNAVDGWITGNIIIDRDIFGAGDYGDYGISLSQGSIAFGVSNSNTICGNTNVANGAWHHIAVTRNETSGLMRIYVDGVLDKEGSGATGNISYRNDRAPSSPDDPYLVIGAEKHDVGPQYPSFDGWVDELRLSNSIRYSINFTRPSAPFTTDANTMALYHFDAGPAGPCTGTVLDSSGASGGPSPGSCNFGGSPVAGPVYTTDVPFTVDTTPPVISNVDAGPLHTISGIMWNTNEPANSQVLYGFPGNLNLNTGITSSYVTSHNVVLVGLAENTTYSYRVVSRDARGNLSQSAIYSFETISSGEIRKLYLSFIRK